MYNKTIIEFGFCDIRNNQGIGNSNQPRPPASVNYTYLCLDYSGYHKNQIQLFFIISNTLLSFEQTGKPNALMENGPISERFSFNNYKTEFHFMYPK